MIRLSTFATPGAPKQLFLPAGVRPRTHRAPRDHLAPVGFDVTWLGRSQTLAATLLELRLISTAEPAPDFNVVDDILDPGTDWTASSARSRW